MAGFLDDLLEAAAGILQSTLQGAGTDVEFAGDLRDFRTLAGKFSLDGGAHPFGKGLLIFVLFQFLTELRREDGEKLGIARDEGQRSVGRPEDHGIACCFTN